MIEAADLGEPERDLARLLDLLHRRRLTILGVTAIAVGAAAAYVLLASSTYRAQEKLVVARGNSPVQPQMRRGGEPIAATIRDLLLSREVAVNVLQNLHVKRSPEDFLRDLSLQEDRRTGVFTVSVDDRSQTQATQYAQQIGLVFSQLVNQRFAHAIPGAQGQDALPLSVTVWENAHPVGKVSPRPIHDVLLALVLGLVLGLVAAFVHEQVSRAAAAADDDLAVMLGSPVLDRVPALGELGATLRSLVVAGATSDDGAAAVVASIARALAADGASVVAVDASLARPRLHEALGTANDGPGVTGVLLGIVDVAEAVRDAGDGVAFMPAGEQPPDAARLLRSPDASRLVDRLSVDYEYVIVYGPAVLDGSGTAELAHAADGALLVLGARLSRDRARHAAELLEGRLLAALAKGARPSRPARAAVAEPV